MKLPCYETTAALVAIERHLRTHSFDRAIREAGRLLERVLREMYQTIYFSAPHSERVAIQKCEEEIGKGTKGVNDFALGEMVRLYREARFQRSWQSQFRADPVLFVGIDLGAIVSNRNRCVHPGASGGEGVAPSQAELCVSMLKAFLTATGYVDEYVKVAAPSDNLDLRNLWNLQKPQTLVVVVANSSAIPTGEYMRPATGIGQVRALSCALKSLLKAYNDVDIRNIYLSTDHLQDHLENDLILLGGPKNNEITKEFLDFIGRHQPAKVAGSRIMWRTNSTGSWSDEDFTEFYGEVRDDSVRSDFGLIVRAKNPFAQEKRTVVLFSGSHTYGTLAAAKYFVEKLKEDHSDEIKEQGNFSILVSCGVRQDYPFAITVEKSHFWN